MSASVFHDSGHDTPQYKNTSETAEEMSLPWSAREVWRASPGTWTAGLRVCEWYFLVFIESNDKELV